MNDAFDKITFDKYSIDKNGCWIWNRGQFLTHNGKQTYVIRVAYEKSYGIIPKGMVVCHKCDVPWCINPDHLFIGTQNDNLQDAISKGRLNNKGSKNGMAKLTEDQVQIIKLFPKWKGSGKMLSRKFNISETQISVIRNGHEWK